MKDEDKLYSCLAVLIVVCLYILVLAGILTLGWNYVIVYFFNTLPTVQYWQVLLITCFLMGLKGIFSSRK